MKQTKERLIDIINDVPVALRPMITVPKKQIGKDKYIVYECKGITLATPWGRFESLVRVGYHKYGIGLSYECDNMPKTLIHEALHCNYPLHSESLIKKHTEKWYKDPEVREVARQRVIYELGRKGL